MRIKKPKKPSKAKQYREWRDAVREQWSYKCAICERMEPDVKLDTHHLISKSIKGCRYDVKVGILLCSLHHHFDSKLSAHKGSLQFILWLQTHHPEIIGYLLKKME
jgi:hypothetical protein